MIKNIKIDGFKNLDNVDLDLKPLTVITGKNSTGKSSLLQAILIMTSFTDTSFFYQDYINSDFNSSRNKYTNAKVIDISINYGEELIRRVWNEDSLKLFSPLSAPILEKNMFYLSANRTGVEENAKIIPSLISGPTGEGLIGYLEANKSEVVADDLVKYPDSKTLSAQLNFWLSEIMCIPIEMNTEKRSAANVEVRYKSDQIPGILPRQLGAGIGYVAKILILCLRSKRNDVILIENPGIHLYPLAQSKLAKFLTFIAANGRQVIIETHSNDIITKIRHCVYKGLIPDKDVTFLYKGGITKPFLQLNVDRNGSFDKEFPSSFFDATLKELLDMEG